MRQRSGGRTATCPDRPCRRGEQDAKMKSRAGLLEPRARASARLGSTSAASASNRHKPVAREQGLNMRVCHWRAVRGPRVRASVGRGPNSATSKTDEWGEVLLSSSSGSQRVRCTNASPVRGVSASRPCRTPARCCRQRLRSSKRHLLEELYLASAEHAGHRASAFRSGPCTCGQAAPTGGGSHLTAL